MNSYPAFELIRVSEGDLVFSDAEAPAVGDLARLGIPKDVFGYSAAIPLSFVDIGSDKRLVCFGFLGYGVRVCVDPRSRQVVEIIDAPGATPNFVNSSLGAFLETMEAVVGQFPFYDSDATDEELDRAAKDVARIVRSIDEPAMVDDRFWSTIVDDVAMGSFATETILRS